MSVTIDFAVEAPGWAAVPAAETAVRRAIEAAVADFGPGNTEIGVVLADDEKVRALNRRWRNQDRSTNVLSFPATDSPQAEPRFLGDVVFAFGTVAREAEADGKPIEHHLAHLAVHGVLHLLGFDHGNDADAEVMESRERRILARLGVADPYAPATRRTEPA